MTKEINDRELKNWADTIGDNFKEDVLEIDLNNPDEFNRIALKFNENQRNKIYSPIISLVKNKNIVFSIKDHKFSKYKNIKNPKSETIENLIPKESISNRLTSKSKELDLIQFTGVIERGKKISANNYGLFNSLNETHQFLTPETFKKYNINIELKENIPLTLIKKDTGNIEISAIYRDEPFVVSLDNANFESAIEKLIKRIHEYYLNLNSD